MQAEELTWLSCNNGGQRPYYPEKQGVRTYGKGDRRKRTYRYFHYSQRLRSPKEQDQIVDKVVKREARTLRSTPWRPSGPAQQRACKTARHEYEYRTCDRSQAGHGRAVRLGAARGSARSPADRRRHRGADRHLPRAARLQLSVKAWPRWHPGVSSIVLRRPPRLDALMRARLENWPIPESRKAQRSGMQRLQSQLPQLPMLRVRLFRRELLPLAICR